LETGFGRGAKGVGHRGKLRSNVEHRAG
jgi:hypothetical protein